jgi:hypothetical protein
MVEMYERELTESRLRSETYECDILYVDSVNDWLTDGYETPPPVRVIRSYQDIENTDN